MGRGEKEELKDWPHPNVESFLILLNAKLKDVGNLSFKKQIWKEIDNEMCAKTGVNYGVDKLKGKFHRLRQMYRDFSELINHTGVTWNPDTNVVYADHAVWESFPSQGKGRRSFKQFKKKGCDHYSLLRQLFGETNMTGLMQMPPSQIPLASNEEDNLEEPFVTTSVEETFSKEKTPIECDDPSDGEERVSNTKRGNRSSDIDTQHVRKKVKDRVEALQSCVEKMSGAVNALFAAELSPGVSGSCSATSSDGGINCSIENCITILDSMVDISEEKYYAACFKIQYDPTWRKVFVTMKGERRKGWVERLDSMV